MRILARIHRQLRCEVGVDPKVMKATNVLLSTLAALGFFLILDLMGLLFDGATSRSLRFDDRVEHRCSRR